MTKIVDKIHDAIEQADLDDLPHDDWPVYLSPKQFKEAYKHVSEYSHIEVYNKGTTICGKEIVQDEHIDEPVVLPHSVADLPMHCAIRENPPEHLLKQVVKAELNSHTDTLRNTMRYRTRVFFDVEEKHLRLKHDKIDKYGLSLPTQRTDFDKQPDHLERVKFGLQLTTEFMQEPDMDYVLREMVSGLIDQIHSVSRSTIKGKRSRVIKGPYPVLDIEHTEYIDCGTEYTHYGGVLLKRIDTPASKMRLTISRGLDQ